MADDFVRARNAMKWYGAGRQVTVNEDGMG